MDKALFNDNAFYSISKDRHYPGHSENEKLQAALYFDHYVLVFIVLSEIPWNTLLGPLRKIIKLRERDEYHKRNY